MNNLFQRFWLRTTLIHLLLMSCFAASAATVLDSSHGGGSAWNLDKCTSCHALRFIHLANPSIYAAVGQEGYTTCYTCHGSNGGEEKAESCIACHNSNSLPNYPPLDGGYSHNFNNTESSLNDDDCMSCHTANAHDSSAIENSQARCGACHNLSFLPNLPALDGTSAHNFGFSGSGLSDDACVVCHETSDMNGQFNPATDLTKLPDNEGNVTASSSITVFCLRCHNQSHQVPGYEITTESRYDPLVAMDDNYRFIDYHGLRRGSGSRVYYGLRNGYNYKSWVECTDCHAMHGTNNPGLLIDRSTKGVSRLRQAFRNMNWQVEVIDGNYAQLCVLCHETSEQVEESSSNTGNGLAGVHQAAGDCRPCHAHGQSIQVGL